MPATKSKYDQYPDDIFADTRMSFGEHIEELRTRMIRAIAGLALCMGIGFVLDSIGSSIGNDKIGIGKPMIEIIARPVQSQVSDFYQARNEKSILKKVQTMDGSVASDQRVRDLRGQLYDEKTKKFTANFSGMTSAELEAVFGKPEMMPAVIPVSAFEPHFGPGKDPEVKSIVTAIQIYPSHLTYLNTKGEAALGSKNYLSTLSVQEAFVMYFKVTLICGVVLSSPWILFQFWAFIGAGLYPHERKWVGVMFWPSVALFIGGILLCQFFVLPGAVAALLKFNAFLGFDPEIRLREWIGLALILPLVFGVSFQTPLVMVFFNRIGTFSAHDYLTKWRYACFGMAVLAAVLTPTPDPVTMLYMFVPMFGLYMVGIVICYYFPGFTEDEDDIPAEEVAV